MHENEQLIPGRYVSKFTSGRQRRCCFVEGDSSLPRNLITHQQCATAVGSLQQKSEKESFPKVEYH